MNPTPPVTNTAFSDMAIDCSRTQFAVREDLLLLCRGNQDNALTPRLWRLLYREKLVAMICKFVVRNNA